MMSVSTFATLRPTNALARLAFSDLNETFTTKRQDTQEDAPPAFRRMVVDLSQIFDRDVFRLRLEAEKKASQNAYASDTDTSKSLPEPDSDTEKQHKELGNIWTGYYVLRLDFLPLKPERGYAVGKGPLENIPVDLLLCTKSFAKEYSIELRNPHARINFFPENRGLYIINGSSSPSAQLIVNGDAVKRQPYALNQHSMNIRLDKLEYTFQWTEYAATNDFIAERNEYVISSLNGPLEVDIDMPTPLPSKRVIGKWTMGDPLGAGVNGRVFFGSSPSGKVAAIKMMERRPNNYSSIDKEVQICKKVTAFAERFDDNKRILRVVDVVYTKDKRFSSKIAFDNVAVILQPMTPKTLSNMCGVKSKGGPKGMKMEAAIAFRDALIALQIMHKGSWMHCDLKPNNIGLIGKPVRAVLLDVGTSAYLQHGTTRKSRPGTLGTVGYLAPELEMEEYDHGIDIWAMGIILYQLTYNDHPWNFTLNPWCVKNEKLRVDFHKSYEEAIEKMMGDYHTACQSRTEGYIHLGGLFVDMVRHQWAAENNSPRPDINEVLCHSAWGPLLPDTPRVKRQR